VHTFACNSQTPDTIYFDFGWSLCEKPNAKYYRIAKVETDSIIRYTGKVADYYIDGIKEMEGEYNDAGMKAGTFIFYYPNGKLKETGNYANDFISGFWDFYYADGKKKATIFFGGDNSTFSIIDFIDKNGEVWAKDGTGMFKWEFPGVDGEVYEVEGRFEKEFRDGTWKYFEKKEKPVSLFLKEEYDKGVMKKNTYPSGKMVDLPSRLPAIIDFTQPQLTTTEDFTGIDKLKDVYFLEGSAKQFFAMEYAKSLTGNMHDTIGAYRNVEIEAAFPGGDSKWRRYMELNFNPNTIADAMPSGIKKITQTAIVEFIVCTDGTICDVKVINEVLPALKKEAERVISQGPKWIPAVLNGKPVKSFRKQPITYEYSSN
jgi:antitoxin component YwqK of YwqJK toxin-antitoxin module